MRQTTWKEIIVSRRLDEPILALSGPNSLRQNELELDEGVGLIANATKKELEKTFEHRVNFFFGGATSQGGG
jgi:hypothetical protein